jgi:O-antigen/teichoic acid export membrane protein
MAVMHNLSWLTISQIVRLVLGLAVGTWLTRTIGPQDNGLLGTAAVIGALAGFVADFGIRQVLIKELAVRPDAAPAIFGTAARITTLLGAGMFFIACAASWFWGGTRMMLLGLALYAPLFLNGWLAILSRWDAGHQAHRTAKAALIANVLSNALKVVCILTGANLVFAAATFALDAIIGAVIAIHWARKNGWLSDLRLWDAALARSLMRESLPLFLSHSGTLLLLRVDQLMVFKIAGDHEAGIYAAATRLSEIVYAAGPVMIMAFLPRLSESFAKDHAMYVRQRAVLFGALTMIAYASMAAWWLFGRTAVSLIYGDAFSQAADILTVHCIAALPYLHGELRNTVLVVEKKSYSSAKAALCGVLLNVALNFWLVPTHGALGAAWATAIAYTVVWFGSSLVMPVFREIGLQQLRALLAPFWIWNGEHWKTLTGQPVSDTLPAPQSATS